MFYQNMLKIDPEKAYLNIGLIDAVNWPKCTISFSHQVAAFLGSPFGRGWYLPRVSAPLRVSINF